LPSADIAAWFSTNWLPVNPTETTYLAGVETAGRESWPPRCADYSAIQQERLTVCMTWVSLSTVILTYLRTEGQMDRDYQSKCSA